MHPAVSKAMFNAEVGRWPPDLAGSRGWIIHRAEYPIVDCEFTAPGRVPLRLFCEFADWDEQPAAVTLRSSQGENLATIPPNSSGVFNSSLHEKTGRPFVCMAGTLEYHTHSSHISESWDQYRGKPGFGMGDLLDKLWSAWLRSAWLKGED